jgi:ribosomal protein L39E
MTKPKKPGEKKKLLQAWQLTSVIPAFRKMRKNCRFETSLGNKVSEILPQTHKQAKKEN